MSPFFASPFPMNTTLHPQPPDRPFPAFSSLSSFTVPASHVPHSIRCNTFITSVPPRQPQFRTGVPRQHRILSTMASTPQPSATNTFRHKYGPWALITGASSGIGAEFARQLAARHRLNLVLVARREEKLQHLASTIAAACNVHTRVVVADLTTPHGIQAVVQACHDLQVGLLVNNAGVEFHGSFFKPSALQHRYMISLNVAAVTELAHAFGKPMCDRGRGGILFVSSISASGMPWLAAYASTKSFVTCLALSIRDELERYGVDCMSLEPGLVASEMTLGPGEIPREHDSPALMDTHVCVAEALNAFGSKPVFTPGFINRMIKYLLLLLPRSTALWLLSEYFIRVMDPEELKY